MSETLPNADKPHSKFLHLYAVVRFDLNMSGENGATVVKVMPSQDLAEQEAARLNSVNHEKTCVYVVQTTRFVDRLGA